MATNHSGSICAVHSLSSRECAGEVEEIILLPAESADREAFPNSLTLCQYHHQLQLMVWGIKKFFEVYPLLEVRQPEGTSDEAWREALAPLPEDSRLYFSLSEELEFWLNRLATDSPEGSSRPRMEFEYLREASIDLGDARLTDKQLMAVCMVFYGGVKKKRAAQAMNITSQALSDHIRAALKKIEVNIARV